MGRQDGSRRVVTVHPADDSQTPILHIDMDAFFASVELLSHPELKGRPVIIGHASDRSVVTSATYEARRFGVRAAMPMAVAMRRCPHAVILEPHMNLYQHYSREVMGIFREITPHVEPLSIDEAFLDVGGARRRLGRPSEIAASIRAQVEARTGLTCSIGVAATKYVAKLASTMAKPDGLLVVPAAETVAFLRPLPISSLWGVGASTEETLHRAGMRTLADVADAPLDLLVRTVGEKSARRLQELARGHDPRSVHSGVVEKSVGHEVTFERDIRDVEALHREILRQSTRVAARLRRAGLSARTVALKLRYPDFTTITRSKTLAEPTDVSHRISTEARALFDAVDRKGRPIRLIGVRAEQLTDGDSGGMLWDPDDDWGRADRVADEVAARFGTSALGPASLLRGGDAPFRQRPSVPD